MSNGKVGEANTGDQVSASDDVLIDAVRDGLEAQYVRFRDELSFMGLTVEQADKPSTSGSALNPLMISFTNTIRLETDSFLSI